MITQTLKWTYGNVNSKSADMCGPSPRPLSLQEDLKTWVNNITASISEHEEIAKWGQPQPTTSSTDEGTRRDGSKADNRSERGGERSDRAERIERAEKEREKERERGDRSERSDRGGKSDVKRSEKSGKKKWAGRQIGRDEAYELRMWGGAVDW